MINYKIFKNPLFYIIIISPFILWALILLQPTSDDWSYITNPLSGKNIYKNILPDNGNYWRPLDAIYGYFISKYYSLFPILNHIIIYIGHLGCVFFIYNISKKLKFNPIAINIAILYFYFSPAMLGTVLGIDSINQVYSHFWGLLGLWFYITFQGIHKYFLWIICIVLSVLSKENGTSWVFIAPILAYGFEFIDKKCFKRDFLIACLIIILYLTIRILSYSNFYQSTYYEFDILKYIKDICIFIGYTWFPIDYVSLVYPPTRNWLIVLVTFLLSLPFLYEIFFVKKNLIKEIKYITLLICILLTAAPHLFTRFGAMHAYNSLSMATLLIAYIINDFKQYKIIYQCFGLFMMAVCFTDYHHWIKSYESGMTGKRMAQQVISKIKTPINKIYIINLDHYDYKYSSFCVIPYESFGWGISVIHENQYKWPTELNDTTIDRNDIERIPDIASQAIKSGFQQVWIVDHTDIKIIQ